MDIKVFISLVALALGLLFQAGLGVWWAAGLSTTVASHTKNIERMTDSRDRLIQVETDVRYIKPIIERIERKIDRSAASPIPGG